MSLPLPYPSVHSNNGTARSLGTSCMQSLRAKGVKIKPFPRAIEALQRLHVEALHLSLEAQCRWLPFLFWPIFSSIGIF